MMDKILPSDFMKGGSRSGQPLSLPTIVVTSLARAAAPLAVQKLKDEVLYSVDSLEKLARAVEVRERKIKSKG